MRRNQPFRFVVPQQLIADCSDRALHCALYALDAGARRAAVVESVTAVVRAAAPRVADEQSLQARLEEAERSCATAVEQRRAALAHAPAHRPVAVVAAALALLVPAALWLPWSLLAPVAVVCAVTAIAVLRFHLVTVWATWSLQRASRARRRFRERLELTREIRIETERAVRLVISSFDAMYEEARSAVASPPASSDGDIVAIPRGAVGRPRSEPRSVT